MATTEEDVQSAPVSNMGATDVLGPPVFMEALDMSSLTEEQSGFITSVRLFETEIRQKSLSGSDVRREFADMFPPASLFSAALLHIPSVHRSVRDFLDANGANMSPHISRRVINTLAVNVYEEAEDRSAAFEMAKDIISRGRKRAQVPPEEPPQRGQSSSHSSPSIDKVAHNVAMRFKDFAMKFHGNVGECWQEYVDEYRQVARDYGLNQKQKLDYLHNLLSGDAKRFYLDVVDGYASGFQQAVDMVEGEYNSIVRQTRVKNYLNTLRLSQYESEGIETPASLERVYKTITKLARQVPRAFRGEEHKVDFLRKAVVGNSWANEPLSRIAPHNVGFQQLYGELESALNLSRESKLAVMQDTLTKRLNKVQEDDLPGILYQGQGRYVQQHKGLGNRSNTTDKSGSFDPLSIMGCFNCEGDHLITKCPHPINTVKAAKRKLDYYSKKKESQHVAHFVLYELCQQLDIASTFSNDHEVLHQDLADGMTDTELFNGLVQQLGESSTATGDPNDNYSEQKEDFLSRD